MPSLAIRTLSSALRPKKWKGCGHDSQTSRSEWWLWIRCWRLSRDEYSFSRWARSADRMSAPQGGPFMNWLDEGALYSNIALFLREDLGRGDITTQSVLARNARAKGRFVAAEKMVVAGLEAAEEVFASLDPQQQLEAFTADGEAVE